MHGFIVYGSRYGSAQRYARALSEQTGLPAVPYQEAPSLREADTLVYIGGVYAGGVLGLKKVLGRFPMGEGRRLVVATVGIADPALEETRRNLRAALARQIPAGILEQAQIIHLRGALDYARLSRGHRTLLGLLSRMLRAAPAENRSAEDNALLESYGKQVDFVDTGALEPIVRLLKEEG